MKFLSHCRVGRTGMFLGLACLTFMVLASSPLLAQSVDEVMAKCIKAQGGRAALLKLKCVERKGEVSVDGTFGQMKGTVEEVFIPWKKARRSLDLDVFVQKEGWNGKTAWRDRMMGVEEIDGQEASQIKQSVVLNPFVMVGQNGAKAKKLDDEKIDDVNCNVVELTPAEGPPLKVFVDQESGLIRRMTITQNNPQFGEVVVTIEPSDYQQFGAVKLATKNKMQLGEILQIDTTFSETKIDGAVDESIFDKPKDDDDKSKESDQKPDAEKKDTGKKDAGK